LQQFHDTNKKKNICSLSTLGKSTDSYEDIVVSIILNKLLPTTLARGHSSNEWNLTDLQQAIKTEVRVFEAELVTGNSTQNSHPTAAFHVGIIKTTTRSTGSSNATSQSTCVFCTPVWIARH